MERRRLAGARVYALADDVLVLEQFSDGAGSRSGSGSPGPDPQALASSGSERIEWIERTGTITLRLIGEATTLILRAATGAPESITGPASGPGCTRPGPRPSSTHSTSIARRGRAPTGHGRGVARRRRRAAARTGTGRAPPRLGHSATSIIPAAGSPVQAEHVQNQSRRTTKAAQGEVESSRAAPRMSRTSRITSRLASASRRSDPSAAWLKPLETGAWSRCATDRWGASAEPFTSPPGPGPHNKVVTEQLRGSRPPGPRPPHPGAAIKTRASYG